MNKLTITLSVVFFQMSFLLYAQEDKLWTLEECVTYAHENNLNVKRSELSYESSKISLNESKLRRLPSLNFSVFNSWRWGRSIDPTTNMFTTERINTNGLNGSSDVTIYSGNRQINSIKQSKTNTMAEQFELEKVKNDIALDVVGGYLNIIFAKELLQNSKEKLQTTSTQLEQIEKKVNAGSLPMTNLLEIRAEHASNEVDVIKNENSVELALLNLKQLLQIPAGDPFDIVTPEFERENYQMIIKSSQDVYNEASEIQPEIKAADRRIESAELGYKIAKGSQWPTLSLSGNLGTNYSSAQDRERMVPNGTEVVIPAQEIGYLANDPAQIVMSNPTTGSGFDIMDGYTIPQQWDDNFTQSVGFNLSIPVFNGGRTRADIQRARIEKDRADINSQERKNVLRQNIESAYKDAQAASKVFGAAEKQVEALEESFRATEKSYNLGASDFVTYQVASFNLFAAKSSLVQAKFDYIFKLKILDFYLGNPLTL